HTLREAVLQIPLNDRGIKRLPLPHITKDVTRALAARDRLDYDGLTAAVGSIVGEDPIWKLRKAALLMELGRSEEATQSVAQAYGDLRENHRQDRQSIPVLSRLLWAHWLLSASQRASGQTIEELSAFAESNYRKWQVPRHFKWVA
ncbi:hypothetical protein HF290_09930, partial [Acidithiobacillus ferrooxidans]|uniref:hypothetical protein n=1 Tax=Acidithiobacillus ferrooxidans TaxID=920 RepID=UPI001C06AAFF